MNNQPLKLTVRLEYGDQAVEQTIALFSGESDGVPSLDGTKAAVKILAWQNYRIAFPETSHPWLYRNSEGS